MAQQLRLLLWKDYLIRKRKLITLVGVLWATAVVSSLYIVRANVDNVDYPTCYFPPRALPSAGMIPFLQSFICSVNNECVPPDQYEEIPTYESATLTQLQRKFTPVLYNDTVMEVAVTVPDALKLLAKLSEIADEPTFIEFSRKGLKFRDLFKNPTRVENYLAKSLGLQRDVAGSLMTSQINLEGIMKSRSNPRSCNTMMEELFLMTNQLHMTVLIEKVCSLSKNQLQALMGMVVEIDFSKFIRMAGNMFYKLKGDERIIELADTVPAVFKLTKLQNFLPMEVARIFRQPVDFSYFDMALVTKFVDLFKQTFTDTESFKTFKGLSEALVAGVQYLDKVLAKRNSDNTVDFMDITEGNKALGKVNATLQDVSVIFKEIRKDTLEDIFLVISPVANFIYKLLPTNTKHEVLFYSTLLAKLIESANKVFNINVNLEERTYNASLRHPEALKTLRGLSSITIVKGFEALADADRVMMITKKIDDPGRIFCDITKLKTFFKVNKVDAEDLKKNFCTDDWKNYLSDLIRAFGIYEIKDKINEMASIVIQETLGKDTSSRLYTLDKDFEILKDFVISVSAMKRRQDLDWMKLFNISDDSEFMKTVRRNGDKGKSILITIHGAIAREVVKQNSILSIKIAPILIDATTLVAAINKQLAKTPKSLTDRMMKSYPDIIETILRTALNEEKTYKALTTPSIDVMCNGVESASSYLELPQGANKEELVETLCDVTTTIENGLKNDSEFGKGIEIIRNARRSSFDAVPWPDLITGIKDLYVKLENDYPYLFEFSTYSMDDVTRENIAVIMKEGTEYWFGSNAWPRTLRLSIKFAFRVLNLLDHDIFEINDEIWLKVKYTLMKVSGPIEVMDDFVKTISAAQQNNVFFSKLPPNGITAINKIVPNLPQLLYELMTLINNESMNAIKILDLINNSTWPCSSTSLGEVLQLNSRSAEAVRSVENLICMTGDEKNQWLAYLNDKGVGTFNLKNWNTTYPPHTYLRFSSAFDMLLNNSIFLVDLARNLTNTNGNALRAIGIDHAGKVTEMLVTGDVSKKDLEDIIMPYDQMLNDVTWSNVVEKITKLLNGAEINNKLRKFLATVDQVIDGVKTVHAQTNSSLNVLWAVYNNCSGSPNIDEHCRMFGRDLWKYTLEFLSVMCDNVAKDILKYFREINSPNASVLQLLGFTEGTPLYEMYENFSSYIAVLVNSFWDHKFMSQIHRASQTDFWDCEAVVDAMLPPPGSPITKETLQSIKPYVCPSLLYWLSLPRGDNTILDLIAKPQYFIYTQHVDKFKSRYEESFKTIIELYDFITELAKNQSTVDTKNVLTVNSVQSKLNDFFDSVTTYKISKNNKLYQEFNEINQKQFASTVYLARVVNIVNKLAKKIEEMIPPKDIEDQAKLEASFINIQKTFKRRPNEVTGLYFDMITDMVFNESYSLVKAWNTICSRPKNTRFVINTSKKLQTQICSAEYHTIFKDIDVDFNEDYVNARKSLLNLLKILRSGNPDNVVDVFEFLNNRTELVNYMRNSIEYSYELGIPVYLQYLLSQLQQSELILTFLSGGDWWKELRSLYNGPYASKFLDNIERSFEIVEDVLDNMDKIHLVRLLRDINVNNTDIFCNDSIILSEYFPDKTGLFSDMKKTICMEDKTPIYAEIPPLIFAAQGYNADLKLSKTVNESVVNAIISSTEEKLKSVSQGPEDPQIPSWVTEEKLNHFRNMANGLLSKGSLTKIAFAFIVNAVDAGTLFLNNSQCSVCSQLTTWFKQLNLQIFKKQEYDNLLCQMQDMSLESVHHSLKHDFHWDMAIRELIFTRNYTNLELNKSLQEFLKLVKLHLLEDLNSKPTKISECLIRNVTKNGFGNATLFMSVLAHTARLLRSELPHLQEIDGIQDLPYLKDVEMSVAHNLEVTVPLRSIVLNEMELKELMKSHKNILNTKLKLRSVRDLNQSLSLIMHDVDWQSLCETQNCEKYFDIIHRNINITLLEKELVTVQHQRFWSFDFLTNILYHIEELLSHFARLLTVASQVDFRGVMDGKLEALIDFMVQLMVEDTLNGVLYSLQGLTNELDPLLEGASLEYDLQALEKGLKVLQQFKNYLLENEYLKIQVSEFFPVKENIEVSLHRQGINNTNFWSLAAPRIYLGQLDLTPIFSRKQGVFHISSYVCSIDDMSKVIIPGDIAAVTADDVYGAVAEQFCGLSDGQVKEILPVLVQGLDFNAIVEKLKSILLPQLYEASNLTKAEGDLVLERYPRMVQLLPVIQNSVGDLAGTLTNEPLIKDLSGFSSVGGLLGSTNFLSNAGKMICGKPFQMAENRFYKAVTSSKDYSTEIDQAQLDVLPTDFCRSMYQDIINMQGGKIVWTFVKPLIMGKILYTPSNSVTEMIMQKANASFANMIRLTSLVHSFAGSFPALDKVASHRDGLSALRAAMSRLGSVLGGGNLSTADIGDLFDDMGDFKDIGKVLKKGSDLLRCFDLNRFRAVEDEYQLSHEAVKLSLVNEFSAGIVFLNTEGKEGLPKNIEYKIRMDIENVPTTARLRNYLWIPGPESSFIENMRYFRGFVQIQDMIDTAIIQLSHSSSRIQKRETRTEDEMKWSVYTQQEPYPCYRKDFFQTSLYESQALLVAFFFSLLFTVSSVVRFIVQEKETGNTMLMSVMGVNLAYHTLSWFVVSLAEVVVTCCCMSAVLILGGVLPQTSVTLLLTLLLIMGLSALSFCYMMSKFFTSASFGAVCTAIAYLVTFMPFVLILSLEAVLSKILKLIVCLAMSSSICYSFLYVARFEAMGRGAAWRDAFTGMDGDDLSIGVGAIMALVDAALYFAIGYLVDRYYGIATVQSSITTCTTTDEKAGVSIINVSKTYRGRWRKEDRLALDNVSIELHKGQITALLGHNGAGKTTLINILTGMLKPSKGHVIVRSEAGATRVGVCAQRDVLHAHLTAHEHVVLYAQLKSGKKLDEVQDEVDSLLQVLSLGAVAHEPVLRLSGGTRRRLCVALAFVAKPQLVSLDEPTSGVDPAARRDIWSMIVKLREDRTILMTTHHLDEAELLSDQIVIMHKGQIHTIGSPIEIKRSLGNGYKLTVSYPPCKDCEEPSIEEKSKQLMMVVRDTVTNAALVDVNGLDVEINLPFFDANGLNNNFLQLCTSVENCKETLGYSSYSMDCSSLEQVFFNICHQADGTANHAYEFDPEMPSHSGNSSSTYSVRSNDDPLVPMQGPLKGTAWQQFMAISHARYLHYIRNRWLLFLLIGLPALFVGLAMGFSMIRPPADNEVQLTLNPGLYKNSTEYLILKPSVYSDSVDVSFAEDVMERLREHKEYRNWTSKDTPSCRCGERRQECDLTEEDYVNHPQMMLLPNVSTLNDWIVSSHDAYIEGRYGGYSSSIRNNVTNFVVWYNNKGHHALPAFLNAMSGAILGSDVTITAHAHTLKISQEQLTKDTVYQHVADAGISALVLIAYSLVSAGGAIYLVSSRKSQEKRLQLLCGVSPVVYWGAALACDMIIILINLVITVILFKSFGFPVFVARNNLPAICLLIVLFGYACACLVHVAEKLFTEPSIANMILFTGNSFVGLAGITLLLILDIISESDTTDNARWALHKVFMLSPQFVLGDGLLEIAKNTIQAQVLDRFGMDTYKDPLSTSLVVHHYLALALVGTALLLLNLAIEYDYFYDIWLRFQPKSTDVHEVSETEDAEVAAERKRVLSSLTTADHPFRLPTIGNINAGFVNTDDMTKNTSKSTIISYGGDVAQCVDLCKVYPSLSGPKVAVKSLTLGIPAGQCTALLGENGAGKSTTFAMLTGEVRPTSGKIYLNGREVKNRELCSGLISYCPQSDAIDALLTARETLQMYCRLRGITEEDKVIKRTIDMFDLTKYADVKNGALSGGNKRKLCTAIAFMGRTPLVLLDEPTSGMDPGSRGCVARGAAAGRRGVLLSTHALGDARRLAGRVALVRAARLAALAAVHACLARFGGGYVVSCRVRRGAARAVWRRLRARAPLAAPQLLHAAALHVLLPARAAVDGKEITTKLSDIFRLMAELQTTCDIEDYTINQSSLDQMFLSFAEKNEQELDVSDAQPPPTTPYDLHSVTSL